MGFKVMLTKVIRLCDHYLLLRRGTISTIINFPLRLKSYTIFLKLMFLLVCCIHVFIVYAEVINLTC